MVSHGISTQVLLTAADFSYLCPAIVNQIDGKNCVIHTASEKAETPPKTYSLQVGRFVGKIKNVMFNTVFIVALLCLMKWKILSILDYCPK